MVPNIEYIKYQNWVQRHHVMTRDVPQSLAFVAFSAHGMGILEKGRKMASTCILMEVVQYPLLFCFRHTSSYYLISIVFVQEGFFPIIGVYFCKEKLLVLCLPVSW